MPPEQPDTIEQSPEITYEELTMVIADLERHFMSQSDTQKNGVPPYLARTTCGITSLHIALSALDCNHNTVDMYNQNIADIVGLTTSNVPYTTVPASIGRFPVDVTVAYFPEATSAETRVQYSQELLKSLGASPDVISQVTDHTPDASVEFRPGFTVLKGTDHRGIGNFISERGLPIRHELIEKTTLPHVSEILSQKPKDSAVALISVRHVNLGFPAHAFLTEAQMSGILPKEIPASHITSHVVVLHKTFSIEGIPCAIISDPAATNAGDGIRVISLATLQEGFSGHASILTRVEE